VIIAPQAREQTVRHADHRKRDRAWQTALYFASVPHIKADALLVRILGTRTGVVKPETP